MVEELTWAGIREARLQREAEEVIAAIPAAATEVERQIAIGEAMMHQFRGTMEALAKT